jgi:SP family galactose:H+ symporter-like MFS transporter
MLAVHAPPASLSRPAARGSRVCPRRATPSVAVGGASARSAFAALRGAGPRPARRAATRWTRASDADDARPEPRYPEREGAVVRTRGSDAAPQPASQTFALFVFTAALSMFAFGVATGSVASALVFLEDASMSTTLTTSAKSKLVAATPLGAVVGALAAPKAADVMGRKKTLLESAGFAYALGAALCCFAPTDVHFFPHYYFLLVGRVMVGIGAGVSTSVTTMYVSECSSVSSRGSAASLCPLFGTAGILASLVAGALLASLVDAAVISPSFAWRCSFGSVLVPVLAQVAMRDCLVESPRWLLASRGEDEARAAARRLGRDVEAELFLEKTIRTRNTRQNARLADLFATAENRAATRVAFLLNAAQQFCGINVVVYFFPRVLKEAFAIPGASAMAVAAGVTAAQVAFGFALARSRVIDTYGRKPVTLCGIIGLICGLACLAIGARFGFPVLAVVGVVAFRFSFAASLGPLPYVVTAEAYASSATRATGVSLATSFQWACNALVSGTFLPLLDRLGPNKVWLVYLGACVVALVAVKSFVSETKDARLE